MLLTKNKKVDLIYPDKITLEFYGADISGSINWKIFHGKINLKNLRQQKERYDFSFSDISEECERFRNELLQSK